MPKVKLFNEELALTSAKDVFWQKGFSATSMQDLVDAMQISRQSLYDTYGNKEELFLKCLNQYQQNAACAASSFLTYKVSLKETLANFFFYYIDDIVSDKTHKGCFMLNTLVELVPENKDAKKVIFKNYDELESAFMKLFLDAKNHSDLHSTFTAEELATHFITSLHGLRLVGKVKKDKAHLLKLVDMAMLVLQ
jgi:TetR/AcrR family transcriptional regulator, transcriptional repressor for nem operon